MVDPHRLHRTISVSNSAPHFGQTVALSGIGVPHSPHSTSFPRAVRRRTNRPTRTAATAAMAMTIHSRSVNGPYFWSSGFGAGVEEPARTKASGWLTVTVAPLKVAVATTSYVPGVIDGIGTMVTWTGPEGS